MHRFGNEGLDLYEFIKVMGNGHEKYPIKENEIVMYSYGEIDARYLIIRQQNKEKYTAPDNLWIGQNYDKKSRTIEEIINTLIENYIKQIKINEEKFKCKSMVYFIVPRAKNIQYPNLYTGSDQERQNVYNIFTEKLDNACKFEKIPIISIYDEIVDSDGSIKNEYLKYIGDIHIDNKFYYLVRDKIMEALVDNNNFK